MSNAVEGAVSPDEADGAPAESAYEDGNVFVSGPFARTISTVQAVTIDLVVGTGRDERKREFLVPYLDVELDGEFLGAMFEENDAATSGEESEDEEGETEQSVSATLSFDNAAFLLERVARRYRKLMRSLEGMSHGGLTPMPGRIDYSARALRRASAELAAAADEMQAFVRTPRDGADVPAPDEDDAD